ncbi:hypothetical protein HN011_007492 [Eciton burchellii]|nr:hypothetical protein HN011_007492 [Eciton burchellii]
MVTSPSGSVRKQLRDLRIVSRWWDSCFPDSAAEHGVPEKLSVNLLERRFHGVSMGCNGDCESVLFDEAVRSLNLRITFPLIALIGIWFARRVVDTPILMRFIHQILGQSARIDIYGE